MESTPRTAMLLLLLLLPGCLAAALLPSDFPRLSITRRNVIIASNNTLNISCSGDRPVEWSWPVNLSTDDNHVLLTDCDKDEFCQTLVVTELSGNDTGTYSCFYEGGNSTSSVHVAVVDQLSPFVPSASDEPLAVTLHASSLSNDSVTIPCLAYRPDLNVTLRSRYTQNTFTPNGHNIQWDYKKGFTIPSGLLRSIGMFFCETTINGEVYSSSNFITVIVDYKIYSLSMNQKSRIEVAVGDRLDLACTAVTKVNVRVNYKWEYPSMLKDNEVVPSNRLLSEEKGELKFVSTINIKEVTLRHQGTYSCTADTGGMNMTNSTTVIVHEKPFIIIDDTMEKIVTVRVGDPVSISVKFTAFPDPEARWSKNGKLFTNPSRYALSINDCSERHSGNYTVTLINPRTKDSERHTFQLIVYAPPRICEKSMSASMESHRFGKRSTLTCTAFGNPAPVNIQWSWQLLEECTLSSQPRDEKKTNYNCMNWRSITDSHGGNVLETSETVTDFIEGRLKSVNKLVVAAANVSAIYKCSATNSEGKDEYDITFLVTRDLYINISPEDKLTEKDNVTLRCMADRNIYMNPVWYKLHSAVSSSRLRSICDYMDNMALTKVHSNTVDNNGVNITSELNLQNLTLRDQGIYLCVAQDKKTHRRDCSTTQLTIFALKVPVIHHELKNQTTNVSETVEVHCLATGTPDPKILWFKNNQPLIGDSGVILKDHNRTLTIQRVRKQDEGVYSCEACNGLGCAKKHMYFAVHDSEEKTNLELVILVGTGVIALFFWILLVIILRTVKRPNEGELKAGYLSIIMDPGEVPLDEQCERLLYDSAKWEFPRDRLKLGKPLGRGAFGQVLEADAFGIDKTGTCKTVAVKMLKEGATESEHRALMSELKILSHIGHHLNVVNLLGACTKPGGPLMVIVEYCQFGNLSAYLRSKRNEFVLYKTKSVRYRQTKQHYVETPRDLKKRLDSIASSQSSASSGFAEEKSLSDVEEEEVEDVCKSQLSMEDLISYSFQVARGMEYMASRRCIHRDLAARNILLADNNVVKICDFGLARDVYKDPDYVRKGDARLPLKWMAPETIFDRVYTTQSDVWSFGVLLWEIFSLGGSPYPGVQIGEDFCRRLKEGTRMRAPDYATVEIYQTMLDCWHGDPLQRPTFSELVEHLGNVLQTNVQMDGKDYIPITVTLNTEEDSGLSVPTSPVSCMEEEEICDAKFHYDNAAGLRVIHNVKRNSRPVSVKTFEDIPVEPTVRVTPDDNQTDSGMILASEEFRTLENTQSETQFLSLLKPNTRNGSVTSGCSNHTSDYQSGYHSDDTEPANEKTQLLKRESSTSTCCMEKAPQQAVIQMTTDV